MDGLASLDTFRLLLCDPNRTLQFVSVGMISFGDDAREQLISRYVITDIALNPGLSPAVFRPEGNGF